MKRSQPPASPTRIASHDDVDVEVKEAPKWRKNVTSDTIELIVKDVASLPLPPSNYTLANTPGGDALVAQMKTWLTSRLDQKTGIDITTLGALAHQHFIDATVKTLLKPLQRFGKDYDLTRIDAAMDALENAQTSAAMAEELSIQRGLCIDFYEPTIIHDHPLIQGFTASIEPDDVFSKVPSLYWHRRDPQNEENNHTQMIEKMSVLSRHRMEAAIARLDYRNSGREHADIHPLLHPALKRPLLDYAVSIGEDLEQLLVKTGNIRTLNSWSTYAHFLKHALEDSLQLSRDFESASNEEIIRRFHEKIATHSPDHPHSDGVIIDFMCKHLVNSIAADDNPRSVIQAKANHYVDKLQSIPDIARETRH